MNALRFGWMIALVGVMALGCDDNEDDPKNAAGAAGHGGSGAAGSGGTSASDNGGADAAGNGGADAAGNGGADAAGNGGADTAGNGGADAAGNGGADAAGAGGAGGAGGAESAPLEVIGEWQSMFGDQTFDETITEDTWVYAAIIEYDNDTNIVITQNPDGNDPTYFPNKYSRVVYTDVQSDSFYYCTSDYGLATLEEARAAHGPADATDFDAGCSGFPWTKLTAK